MLWRKVEGKKGRKDTESDQKAYTDMIQNWLIPRTVLESPLLTYVLKSRLWIFAFDVAFTKHVR